MAPFDNHKSPSARSHVLIVDDEEHIREIVKATLEPLGAHLHLAASAEEAYDVVQEQNVDVVVCDIKMPGMDGLEFLNRVKNEHPGVQFLMMTAHGSMEAVIQAMRYGASDFLTKPFENARLRETVQRLLNEKTGREEPITQPATDEKIEGIIGSHPLFRQCLDTALKAATSDSSVLILGESGTGKEVFAQAIHRSSIRSDKPFIALNCGAIPEKLMESELFGYEKGAFTGAMGSKPGKITLADSGTLFLDEIGELPLVMQVKLLRVLQERTVEPVGSTSGKKVDFRLIAATNRDLEKEVAEGRFRQDLFYRLNIIPIELPPLRKRGEDVLALAGHFLGRFNERYDAAYSLEGDHRRQLMDYAWPGNIRELENVVERAVVLGRNGSLAMTLPNTRPSAATSNVEEPTVTSSSGSSSASGSDLKTSRMMAEREEILKALERHRWNKTRTAESLGISRRSLLYKVKEYAID